MEIGTQLKTVKITSNIFAVHVIYTNDCPEQFPSVFIVLGMYNFEESSVNRLIRERLRLFDGQFIAEKIFTYLRKNQ